MTRSRRIKTSLRLLASALGTWLFTFGCGSDVPLATGTKTDWFRSCEQIEDCGDLWAGECLCGICTNTCETDGDCEQGSCGSTIDVAAACGNQSDLVKNGKQICVSSTEAECTEAVLSTDALLGDAQQPTCEVAGALICEDFNAPLPENYSTWGTGVEAAGLQECQVNSGSGALRIQSVDDAYVQARMRLPQAIESGPIYARFYLRVEEGGVFPQQLILFELWDQEEGDVVDRTTVYLNESEQLEVYVGPASVALPAQGMAPLSRDTWHCVELGLEISDEAGTVFVGLDNTTVIETETLDTHPSDPLSVAVLESVPKQGSVGTEVTLLVDDLVVATERVFCD